MSTHLLEPAPALQSPPTRAAVSDDPRRVYVVMGTSGEYSDRTEWPVAAYLDENLAREHVARADAEVREAAAEVQARYKVAWLDKLRHKAASFRFATGVDHYDVGEDVTHYYHSAVLREFLP